MNRSLEERLQRLETAFGQGPPPRQISSRALISALALALASLALGTQGFGLPNHPYQIAVAALFVALAYHRGWLGTSNRWAMALAATLNAAQLSFIMKLFIGGGRRYPFFWLKWPTIHQPDLASGNWYDVVPKWTLGWEPTALTTWEIDFTVMQTFLLIVTLIGALFRFQPFVSLTALALVFISIPALLGFQWAWVFPAIVCCAVSLYLQSSANISK